MSAGTNVDLDMFKSLTEIGKVKEIMPAQQPSAPPVAEVAAQDTKTMEGMLQGGGVTLSDFCGAALAHATHLEDTLKCHKPAQMIREAVEYLNWLVVMECDTSLIISQAQYIGRIAFRM